MPGNDADRPIRLLHHPWEYLAELDCGESRQKVHLHRDLLLRGHLHEGEACFVRPPDPGRACLELAAGCFYEGSFYPNAFQWIELESGSNGNPKSARVHFRRWVQGNWQVDRNQPGCAEGTAELDLSEAEARSPATAGSTTSAGRRPSPKLNAVIMAAGAGLLFGPLALEAL